jgi:hypothetical protein
MMEMAPTFVDVNNLQFYSFIRSYIQSLAILGEVTDPMANVLVGSE